VVDACNMLGDNLSRASTAALTAAVSLPVLATWLWCHASTYVRTSLRAQFQRYCIFCHVSDVNPRR